MTYAVGIGARPGVRSEAVRALLEGVLARSGLDPADAVFATVAARVDEPGIRAAVRAIAPGAEPVAWPAEELAGQVVPHPSDRVAEAVGTPSVAEAAALRTARTLSGATDAELLVPKTVGDGVTAAISRPRRRGR
jgi:cobalamin biosynthesis protein CbiG